MKEVKEDNLMQLLKEEVVRSASAQGFTLPHSIEEYLAELVSDTLYGNRNIVDKNLYIAEVYLNSFLMSNSGRLSELKKAGDACLVKTGLFIGTQSKAMSRDYYLEVGSSAFDLCYQMSQNPTYMELANNMSDYSDVLYGVKNCSITNNIISLYEDWKNTKSNFSKRRLIALGFSFNMTGLSE